MLLSLRVAAIVSMMAVVASTSVTAQTTGTIPPPAPPSQLPPPPTANQYSSNEIIDAGHRFFGGVSRDLAGIVEKAVSQWGLPSGGIKWRWWPAVPAAFAEQRRDFWRNAAPHWTHLKLGATRPPARRQGRLACRVSP
jgi:hypothetical protein